MADENRLFDNARPAAEVVAARKREIKQRYDRQLHRRAATSPTKDRIKSLRRTQVLRLFQQRHGATLPDDEVGREGLQALFELGLDGPTAQRLAPWADGKELDRLMQRADENWSFYARNGRRNAITQRLGERLQVTIAEKLKLDLTHLGCIDIDPRRYVQHLREKKRKRDAMRRARQRQERAAQADASADSRALPTCWQLRDKNPRAFALATGPLARLEWLSVTELVAMADWFAEFRNLRSDARRRAVHRAVYALKEYGVAEVSTVGRPKLVRLLSGNFAEEAHALLERWSFEEAAKDLIDDDTV
jgi:hypothetical protein